MTSHLRLAACCALLAGCSGTRLYERAERAASAGQWDQAVAYDTLSEQDGRALPQEFPETYRAHTAAFLEQKLAALGAPTDANADAQDAVVRGWLLWIQGRSPEPLVRQKVGERLGQLAQVRWPRVQRLVAEGRLDEAAVLARSLLEEATGADALVSEAKDIELRARTQHLDSMQQASGQLSAKALHARLAELMGAAPTPEMNEAEAALVQRTGMKLAVDRQGGSACEAAVSLLSPFLPPPGDIPAHFHFKFTRCEQDFAEDHHTAYRTRTVSEMITVPVVDTRSHLACKLVQTGSATICDSSERVGRFGSSYLVQRCHEEGTYGQECHTEYTAIERTEHVRTSYQEQVSYEVYRKQASLRWTVELTAEIGGHQQTLTSQGNAQSRFQEREGSSPDSREPLNEATEKLALQLAGTVRELTRFAMADRASTLEQQASEAKSRGEAHVAQALWTESGVLRSEAPAPLVEQLAPQHVPAAMLTAALRRAAWSFTREAPKDIGLPTISLEERSEDAREITDSVALSAQSRSRYQGALLLGLQQFRNTGADPLQSKGVSLAAFGGGASPTPVPLTCLGGTMHIDAAFDSKVTGLDVGMTMGAGLKALGLCILPVVGLVAGTSTHANPEEPNFLPNAAVRPSGIDGAWGSQLTLALPYPLNATLNARVLRTLPLIFPSGLKQATSRAEVVLGWRFMPELEFMAFGRYWQTATATGLKALDFFKGDGKQRETMVIGLGIGGGYDRPPWETGN